MSPPRLLSLDAFRGITVAAMVLVNNPGTWRAVYPPLRHAEWHGWTPTDLVFPFFLFIVGVAIPLALGRRLGAGQTRSAVAGKILRRSVIIFGLGLLLHAIPDFDFANIRVPGVLQRIAVCYLAAALLFLWIGWRAQAGLVVGLLAGYWAVLTLVPVPGFGAGNLSPEGSLAAYVDRSLLGPHIWRAARVYDPEGLLSTAPAIATTLIGVLAGHWLVAGRPRRATVVGLLIAGAAGFALGEFWGLWFPINKPLWTSSYVMMSAGLALLVLGVFYWIVEAKGWRAWTRPFVVLGVNALALFFLSILMARLLLIIKVDRASGRAPLHAWLFDHLFAPWATPINASLTFALAYLLLWLAVMWLLDRHRIRLTV
ncbi:MAG: acyltransferase family protein [Gammaproteobacteria bacterium]